MGEWYAGEVADYSDDVRKVITIDDTDVIVLMVDGSFYALRNECLHMGGPVGEGVVMGRICAVLDDQKRLVREEFDEDAKQLICPWHGWAYDLKTGAFAGDERLRLPTYEVEIREGKVYVLN